MGIEVDADYPGLVRDFPGQVSEPPKKLRKYAGPTESSGYHYERHRRSTRRIMVEYADAEVKPWGSLQCWTVKSSDLAEPIAAAGGPALTGGPAARPA